MHMPDMDIHFPYLVPDMLDPWYSSPIKSKPGRVVKAQGRVIGVPGYRPLACEIVPELTPVWNRCPTLSAIFDQNEMSTMNKRDTVKEPENDCKSSPTQPTMSRRAKRNENDSEEIAERTNGPSEIPEEPSNSSSNYLPSLDEGIVDSVCATYEVVTVKKNCNPTLLSEGGRDQDWVWV